MTRKEFITGAAALSAAGIFADALNVKKVDSPELAASKKWFKEAQF